VGKCKKFRVIRSNHLQHSRRRILFHHFRELLILRGEVFRIEQDVGAPAVLIPYFFANP
jgi:hypothetical protein